MRILLFILLAALGLALFEHARRHPGDVPWGRLSLAEPIGRFTVLKLGRLHDDFPSCRARLAEAGQPFRIAQPLRASSECVYGHGVLLAADPMPRISPATVMTCPLAAGLFLLRHQVIAPAAERHFHQPVIAIETFGTYSCRRIGSGREGRYSEHASANAIDIAAFRLADGRRIAVASGWRGHGPEAAFLRDVRDGACRVFGTTLSPDYNAAHRDHLHLDQALRGMWGFCR